MRPLENARFRKSEPDDERAKGQVARVFIHVHVCVCVRARASREFAAGAKQRVSCV